MDSTSFEDLSQHFTSKLDGIGTLLVLRDASQDKMCVDQIESLKVELHRQTFKLSGVKKELAARKENLDNIRDLNEVLKEWKKKLTYMVDNMPALPKKNAALSARDVQTSQCSVKQEMVQQETRKQQTVKPVKHEIAEPEIANTYYPEIDWLTVDEFDKIPKYLKGRLAYEQVNKFIEGMNKAYCAKYKLLKMKKSVLNDAKRKKYEAYKMQETKDTKGCYFVVDDDLKEFGGLKMDNMARSTLTILRHCGRCREVRGGKLTRYCYIDSY